MSLKRIIYDDVVADLKRKEIGIIMGPRQVGKTTLLKELAVYHRKSKEQYSYFNLEMPTDANYFARDFKDVLADIGRGYRQLKFLRA